MTRVTYSYDLNQWDDLQAHKALMNVDNTLLALQEVREYLESCNRFQTVSGALLKDDLELALLNEIHIQIESILKKHGV